MPAERKGAFIERGLFCVTAQVKAYTHYHLVRGGYYSDSMAITKMKMRSLLPMGPLLIIKDIHIQFGVSS